MNQLQILLLDADLVRMTFVIGIATSVLMYERTHTTTGSIVVPGYIAVQLLNPVGLAVTAVNALLTFYLVARVLPRFAAVYGRSRFVINIFTSVLISLLMGQAFSSVLPETIPALKSIGYAIPALIAYDMNRQGMKKTGVAVARAGVLAALPALFIVAIWPDRVVASLPANAGLLEVTAVWFPIAALVSTSASTILQANHGLRCGGFIGAMYLGLSAERPIQVLYFLGVAVLTYVVVMHGMSRVMIIFGRRKFAVMLMGGSLLSWVLLDAIEVVSPGLLPIGELTVASLFVPALLANDMQRSSVGEVILGSIIGASFTLSMVVVMAGLVDNTPISFWAFPLLIASSIVMFFPQLTRLARWVAPNWPSVVRKVGGDTKNPCPSLSQVPSS